MMFNLLQVVTVMLVAVAMALAIAHALEFPGNVSSGIGAGRISGVHSNVYSVL